ncbi:MAG: hypothetical protein O2816_11035 [Planctomycetota bacterium]|nr:hypothetical protein [Planctomycetota bacterium]
MTRLQGRPFALIGVNPWPHEPGELEAVMVRERLNWRSFDGGEDVSRLWNSPPTPSFYLLDHEGIIRRKWIGNPGEEAIDAALKKLVREAEGERREPRQRPG